MLWRLTSALVLLVVATAVGVVAGETAGIVIAAVGGVALLVLRQTQVPHRR